MSFEIRSVPLSATLSGTSKVHDPARSYGQEIRELLDPVWAAIRSQKITHKGINWVVYDEKDHVFSGVEADIEDPAQFGLERRIIRFERYAVWKHIGPYDRLAEAYAGMKREMASRQLHGGRPFIEKYGHWTDDASKLETDLLCPIP